MDIFKAPGGIYTPSTDKKVDSACCGVCESGMLVNRNISKQKWFTSAETKVDFFYCPHISEKWHIQATALLDLAEKSPSAVLTSIYLKEIEDLINTKEATTEFKTLPR